MKVCAHINAAPFVNVQKHFDTVGDAVRYFRHEVAESPYRGGNYDDDGCYAMDLYPQIDPYDGKPCECDDSMNFHDYPMVRYVVGRRGGVRRERV